MSHLLDTHVLLWAAMDPDRLPSDTAALLADPAAVLWFSAASLWEVGIKAGLGCPDFAVGPGVLRAGLVAGGYRELAIDGRHAVAAAALPPLHRDPFDRMLVAQARAEGLVLVTADAAVAGYGPPAELIRPRPGSG